MPIRRRQGVAASTVKLARNGSAIEDGDLRHEQVTEIADRLGVTEDEVVSMNRRLAGDASLNAPIRAEADSGEWQDWLVDESDSQESMIAEQEELDMRRKMLGDAMGRAE